MITVFPPASWAVNIDKVVDKMREKIAEVNDFSAEIKQSFFWKVLNKHQEMKGMVYMKKPDKFIIDFKELIMVSNGEFVWRYTPETKQVLQSKMQNSPEVPRLNDLIFEFDKNYEIENIAETKDKFYILSLIPKHEIPNVKKLRVWLDTRDWLIKEVHYIDDNENETMYQLKSIKINQKLKDAMFDYQAPKGAELFETD